MGTVGLKVKTLFKNVFLFFQLLKATSVVQQQLDLMMDMEVCISIYTFMLPCVFPQGGREGGRETKLYDVIL